MQLVYPQGSASALLQHGMLAAFTTTFLAYAAAALLQRGSAGSPEPAPARGDHLCLRSMEPASARGWWSLRAVEPASA